MPAGPDRIQCATNATNGYPPMVKRNFWLGVANGGLVMVAFELIQPAGVLTFLILGWTDQKWVLGLMTALSAIGFAGPQLLVAHLLERRPRKLPFYWVGSSARVVFMLALSALLLRGPHHNPAQMLVLFLTLFTLFRVGAAIGNLAFSDILAKSIPPTRRGLYVLLRRVIAGVLILCVSGPFISQTLSESSSRPFPTNFAPLFITATALMAVAWTLFSLVKEPIRPVRTQRTGFREHLRRGPRLWRRDTNLRRMLCVSACGSLTATCIGFYVAYAKDVLGASSDLAGHLVRIAAGALLVGNGIWGMLSDRVGNRTVLMGSTGCGVAAAVVMVIASVWRPEGAVDLPLVGSLPVPMVFIYATAVLMSVFGHGQFMGEQNYLLEIAPETLRPTYISFWRFILAPMAIWPPLAGYVVDRVSYTPLFAFAALASATGMILARRLAEPRRWTEPPKELV